MHSEIEYRGYAIWHDGFEFVGEPKAVDDTLFEVGSHSIELVTQTIDEMLGYLDTYTHSASASAPPAWFQLWIDNGAAGRIRILKPKSFEFEHLKPARKRRKQKIIGLGSLVSYLMGAVMVGYAFADIDGDGRVDAEDIAVLVDTMHMRAPRREVRRLVEFDGKDYVLTAVPSPRDDCDYQIRLTAAEKTTM